MSKLPRPSPLYHLPLAIVVLAIAAMLWHGPIAQLANYHDFADSRAWFGLPNAADVLSNLGFFLVGAWGLLRLQPKRGEPVPVGWPGYRLFLIALILTAFGSAFYHAAPDNYRLLWDRLPIALACAGLLAGVRAETHGAGKNEVWLWAGAAVISVGWWYLTEQRGQGDLRPYLLLQALPLVLIPLWQWLYRSPRTDRIAFAIAIVLYIAAKAAELQDHAVLDAVQWCSGHTIKHLLATIAAGVLVARLVRRRRASAHGADADSRQSSLAPEMPSS